MKTLLDFPFAILLPILETVVETGVHGEQQG